MTIDKKPWYKSKTKWSAILLGGSVVLATVGGVLSGSIEFMTGIKALIPQIAIILAVFGVRDLPFINRK